MVEVVSQKEFDEFSRGIEKKLEAIDRKLSDLINDIGDRQRSTDANLEELNKQLEELSESSKGFIDRLREALGIRQPEASALLSDANPVGETEKTLGRVADVIMRCPNFFNWDFCHENCPMYVMCDDVATVQDSSKLEPLDVLERLRGVFKRLGASFQSRRGERFEGVEGP